MRSSLSRFQPISPMSDEEMLDKQMKLYEERGSLLITKEQIDALPQTDRWSIEVIARKLFGKGSR